MALIAQLNPHRRIGAEFECAVPIIGAGDDRAVQDVIAHVLSSNGIRACSRPYNHDPVPPGCDVAVERDNSIVGEERFHGVRWAQIEVKTRILSGIDDWERIVPPMLEIVRFCGGRVTPTCGHHLHLSFDEFTHKPRVVRSLWNLFHRFDNVLFGLVAPSRKLSNYCRPMPSSTKLLHGANSAKSIRRVLSGYDRYQALNLTHIFDEEPHLELRHHHGTLDANKARMWLRLSLALVQHAVTRSCHAAPKSLFNDRQSLEALLITCGLKVNTRVYASVCPKLREAAKQILKTWKKFNPAPSKNAPAAGAEGGEPCAE